MKSEYSRNSVDLSRFTACCGALDNYVRAGDVSIEIHSSREPLKNVSDLRDIKQEAFPVHLTFKRGDDVVKCIFQFHWELFVVTVEAANNEEASDILQMIEGTLGLTEPTEGDRRRVASLPNIASAIWQLHDKLELIEEKVCREEDLTQGKLRCFVSFRFDEHSKSLAFELREFLELSHCEFLSGLGYEPRSISDKVLDRLSIPLDLFIVIFSSSGDSAWMNQEVGVARARHIPVLVLIEEGGESSLGMLGDTEYLKFPKDQISSTFVGILQALRYIREHPADL